MEYALYDRGGRFNRRRKKPVESPKETLPPSPVPPSPIDLPGNGNSGDSKDNRGSSNLSGTSVDIKIAQSNLFLIKDEDVPIEVMTDLIFEDIGGQEIISIARNTSINGQDVLYQPIKNLSAIALQYNSENILSIQNSSNSYFNNFSIKLENYIPINTKTDPVDGIEPVEIEQFSGDIIINLVNVKNGEQAEVQILKTGSVIDDTIY